MSTRSDDRPQINIIRKKKVVHAGHGGAWKVAYADFVTAMMSLFIVLWIIGQSKQVRDYVAEYFKNPGAFSELTRSGALSGGLVPVHNSSMSKVGIPVSHQESQLMMLKKEGLKLEHMIASKPEFSKFKNQIKITISKEGLRIELIENAHGLFFAIGSAALQPETAKLLSLIAKELGHIPNRIIIEGYTDARQFVRKNYSNWELSTDRANAARRVMQAGGLRPKQVLEVRGYADNRLRDPANPYSYTNRRVSILVTPLVSDTTRPVEKVDTLSIGGSAGNGGILDSLQK